MLNAIPLRSSLRATGAPIVTAKKLVSQKPAPAQSPKASSALNRVPAASSSANPATAATATLATLVPTAPTKSSSLKSPVAAQQKSMAGCLSQPKSEQDEYSALLKLRIGFLEELVKQQAISHSKELAASKADVKRLQQDNHQLRNCLDKASCVAEACHDTVLRQMDSVANAWNHVEWYSTQQRATARVAAFALAEMVDTRNAATAPTVMSTADAIQQLVTVATEYAEVIDIDSADSDSKLLPMVLRLVPHCFNEEGGSAYFTILERLAEYSEAPEINGAAVDRCTAYLSLAIEACVVHLGGMGSNQACACCQEWASDFNSVALAAELKSALESSKPLA
ncbi:hypothetical protein BDR26DRAFT_929676 [Obelidium mucronatum]|nr:hypothetical protein BDR26DRAFT_929676 [Obelidium mucronatum]